MFIDVITIPATTVLTKVIAVNCNRVVIARDDIHINNTCSDQCLKLFLKLLFILKIINKNL